MKARIIHNPRSFCLCHLPLISHFALHTIRLSPSYRQIDHACMTTKVYILKLGTSYLEKTSGRPGGNEILELTDRLRGVSSQWSCSYLCFEGMQLVNGLTVSTGQINARAIKVDVG